MFDLREGFFGNKSFLPEVGQENHQGHGRGVQEGPWLQPLPFSRIDLRPLVRADLHVQRHSKRNGVIQIIEQVVKGTECLSWEQFR